MSKPHELSLPPKAEHEIDLLSKADCFLAEARTIAEVMDIRAKAQAAKVYAGQFYANQADLCRRIVVNASAIMVMAERRLGEILRTLPLAKSSPGNQHAAQGHRSHDATGPILLKTVGVSKSRSSRAQQVASLPLATFSPYGEHMSPNVKACSSWDLRLMKCRNLGRDSGSEIVAPGSPGAVDHDVTCTGVGLDRLVAEARRISDMGGQAAFR
jgi:hypothetical protein